MNYCRPMMILSLASFLLLMASTPAEHFEHDGHAWREAKIHELGTRMGGLRAIYHMVTEHFCDAEPYSDEQFLRDDDPEDIKQLLIIARVYVWYVGAMRQTLDTDFGALMWKSLVKDGVVKLYLDIVESKGFLAEDVRLVDVVVSALAIIVQYAKNDSAVANLLLSRMRDVWKSFWDTRHMIRPYARTEHSPLIIKEHGKYEEFTTDLLTEYCQLYQDRYNLRYPPAETYIPHVALAFWMRDSEHIDLTDSASSALEALSGLLDPYVDVLKRHVICENFVQEAIIDGVGLEAFCRRTELDISRQYHPEDLCVYDYDVWHNLAGLMVSPKILPCLIARGTLDSLISLQAALMKIPGHTEEVHHVWNSMYTIFWKTYHEHWRAHIQCHDVIPICHIPGEYLMDVMSMGLQQAATHGCKGRAGLLGDFLCQDIALTTKFFNDLRKEPARFKPEARKLFAQCRSSAPTKWYPALNALQVSAYRGVMDEDLSRLLINAWLLFGLAVGLRPDKERARFERLKRVHCAWSLCAHHYAEPDVQLKACQGCGEVRYCSRACQKSDWKAHKGRCGNRVKPVPVGTEG
ncbi:hypothetical protein PENSPDRAFT_645365 [Peniophora sp. CONT]|nr:hypothetical protein PENSPDRAFT_645365 [Peniophora sp. CONT]